MGWTVLIVLVVVAAVIFGSQILYIKIFTGEADDAIFNGSAHSRRKTFCKALDKKLPHYHLPVRWLAFYINILLPAITLAAIYGLISEPLTKVVVLDAALIVHIMFVMLCLLNTILIRALDAISFWINILFMVVCLADIAISIFAPLLLLASFAVIPIAACNMVYFAKRRKLFFFSEKQLAAQNAE